MSEAKNFRYYRISINEQPDQVSRLSSLPLLSCSSKYVTEIYRAHYMGTPYLCSSEEHKYGAWNPRIKTDEMIFDFARAERIKDVSYKRLPS